MSFHVTHHGGQVRVEPPDDELAALLVSLAASMVDGTVAAEHLPRLGKALANLALSREERRIRGLPVDAYDDHVAKRESLAALLGEFSPLRFRLSPGEATNLAGDLEEHVSRLLTEPALRAADPGWFTARSVEHAEEIRRVANGARRLLAEDETGSTGDGRE